LLGFLASGKPTGFWTSLRWCFFGLVDYSIKRREFVAGGNSKIFSFSALYAGEMVSNLTVAYFFKWVGETPPTRHVKYTILS